MDLIATKVQENVQEASSEKYLTMFNKDNVRCQYKI